MTVGCGNCRGCRYDRARDWQTRLIHERRFSERASFVTLTYNNAHLPDDYSVDPQHHTDFMKRLRWKYARTPIRFFMCGEYGDRHKRPHYHYILFGVDFREDRYLWRRTGSGFLAYRSPGLESVWQFGNSEVGDATAASCGYVARYVLKKVTGDVAEPYYTRVHPLTGEVVRVRTEFTRQSNKPGIGARWFELYGSDAFPSDFLIVDGRRVSVPRYYLKKLPEDERKAVQRRRRHRAYLRGTADQSAERLAVREEVQRLRLAKLVRELDGEDDDSVRVLPARQQDWHPQCPVLYAPPWRRRAGGDRSGEQSADHRWHAPGGLFVASAR